MTQQLPHGPIGSAAPLSPARALTTRRDRLYNVIFESDTPAGKLFDILLLIAIVASVTATCLETVPSLRAAYGSLLLSAEWFFTIVFTIEYFCRLYCVRNRIRYATSFYGVIDLLSILPLYLTLVARGSASFAVLRSFRLLRIFRILKLYQLSGDAEELAKAIWQARGKVLVFLTFVVISVTVAGALMYEIEQAGNPDSGFSSIPQSIYWAVVTMTTVGYGDIVPQTTLGKLVSTALILIGYSLIIVPTGFVSAEMITSRTGLAQRELTRVCPSCLKEGHEKDARYCRHCGQALNVD